MRHFWQPPGAPVPPSIPAAPLTLARMQELCEEVILSLPGGGAAATDRGVRQAGELLRALPGQMARGGPCARSLGRATLAGMADRLTRAALEEGWRRFPGPQRTDSEGLLGALIARMRLVARNFG
jgi:hypothetical protein